MAHKVESNNLVYDELDPRCKVHVIGGICYIELLDLGAQHARFEVPEVKRYCGAWSWDDPKRSISSIVLYGHKWKHLPKV